MAYKYVNDNGLKAYTKKVKGALKDLHTPIAISTENTTKSKAQNVKNIADFVAKAKAAGIADVNGMAVTCLIDNDYSGVGYLYVSGGNILIQGVLIKDDLIDNMCFNVFYFGDYIQQELITSTSSGAVISSMLDTGARNPIIFTPDTTRVDEKTYQKLLRDDVDVVFKASDGEYCVLTYKEDVTNSKDFYFSCFSCESVGDTYLYAYIVHIAKTAPHTCTQTILHDAEPLIRMLTLYFVNKDTLSPVLKEIDLTGTDAERKAKLAQFETDWKALTGASDMSGARFVGQVSVATSGGDYTLVILNKDVDGSYSGLSMIDTLESTIKKIVIAPDTGSLTITPLFSLPEPVKIFTDNSAASKQKNIANLNAYKANLKQLGVDTSMGFQVPIENKNRTIINGGVLFYSPETGLYTPYRGLLFVSDDKIVSYFAITPQGEVIEEDNLAFSSTLGNVQILAQAVKAFGAIELKASDNAANKATLTAYLKILTDAGVTTTNGYSVPVRITGNAQEYHGMLNIGTGALLSGIVTDVNENHHYPFNVSTADGVITFDENNYFLEKTSNEVTEMLDAIKYSYTPVPLTATTLSNKAQLEVFLSKVPNAQVMHCTYKDVYAGTLHKINGSWYGVLVGESNTLAGQLSIKLQADGTIVEGTA